MYLDFEDLTPSNSVKDKSGNGNDAVLLKGARISGRKLGRSSKHLSECHWLSFLVYLLLFRYILSPVNNEGKV